MRSLRVVAFLAGLSVGIGGNAAAQAAEGVPYGYDDCGWKDYINGGWTADPEAGVYLHAFARDMTCASARRNIDRINFSGGSSRPGYKCMTLANDYEYTDVRCRKIGKKATFRYQTGS